MIPQAAEQKIEGFSIQNKDYYIIVYSSAGSSNTGIRLLVRGCRGQGAGRQGSYRQSAKCVRADRRLFQHRGTGADSNGERGYVGRRNDDVSGYGYGGNNFR